MKLINPATGAVLATVEASSAETVATAYIRARNAQPAWAAQPLSQRLAIIEKFRDRLQLDKETLARLLSSEMGKPVAQARNELSAMSGRLDYFIKATPAVMADEIVHQEAGALEEVISHEALGVIGNISAWNYPYFVGSNVFAPALLTGNAVLYKPSEYATLTGQAIAERLHACGVPEDIFIALPGDGTTGAALCDQPLDGLFFTGSNATGRRVAQAAAARLIKVQLELGGKDPTYVCDDASPKAAAESLADGAMYNNGQSCCSVERIYVHHTIVQAFIDNFVATVKGFAIGDPMDDRTYISALARKEQLAVLADQVADAVAHGARVLCGGNLHPTLTGAFQPTVLTNVDNTMKVMREESFGPVIGIMAVKDDNEAIALMNDSDYGLTAGVYTKDPARAKAILRQINAGSVYWNCCDRVSPRLPWTGRRGSGLGSTLSTYGIRSFMQPKAWHLRVP